MQQHNDSLLFQFILNEILFAAKILDHLPARDKLVGGPISPWNFQWGRLHKLQSYFLLFEKDPASPLYKLIEQLIADVTASDLSSQEIREILKQLKKIALQIFDKLVTFHDENILYFILRKQEELDRLCGPKFVLKHFRTLFPEGNEGEWMTSRYAKRGFFSLVPLIRTQLENLK